MLPVWFYAASPKAQSCATPLVDGATGGSTPQPLKQSSSDPSSGTAKTKVIDRRGICGFEPLLWVTERSEPARNASLQKD